MGAGIGLVRGLFLLLAHLGLSQIAAFTTAFALIGSTIFGFALYWRRPESKRKQIVYFAVAHALLATALCVSAYLGAGSAIGLICLAAMSGWYHSTWFTAASVVGQRIGGASSAVIATSLEGGLGFSIYLCFLLFRG